MLLLWALWGLGWSHTGVMLAQVAWMGRARLGLWGDAMGGGLGLGGGLHARGRAGVGWLGLGPG